MITALMLILAGSPIALQCKLQTEGNDPPMYLTLNDETQTVQVTMAGQTYLEDTIVDGPLTWWQVKGSDGVVIRSRLNRADGTLIITNPGTMVKGNCGTVASTPPALPRSSSGPKAPAVRQSAEDPADVAAARIYQACVFAAARRFSRTKETAPVVAESSMQKCSPQRSTFYKSIASKNPPAYTKALFKLFDDRVFSQAQLVVVEARSKKTAK